MGKVKMTKITARLKMNSDGVTIEDKHGLLGSEASECFPDDDGGHEYQRVTCTEISASEALFGFMGWLSSRDEAITFSGHHNAGIAADLVALFCEVNNLAAPRDGWDRKLVHPKECRPDGVRIGGVTQQDRPPSPWRPHLESILSKLSGDFNYGDVAEAKKMLKDLIDS